MKTTIVSIASALVVVMMGSLALADGMIVPIRPEIRVRGHWAVKYHRVNITVRDQTASVEIDQEFVNTGRGMIEVEYLFPVPPDAAIDSMTLVVDGKEFAARLLKADEARKIYEDIVRRKKDPALLEYAGFGLYRTRAFPLEPGKPVRVVVTYKNICKKDHDLVEVWYPLNTEKFSARPIEDVTIRVDIKSKADITAVYSPTHNVKWKHRKKDPRHVIATYHEQDTIPATDFQLFYQESDDAVSATLMTHQPDANEDGYFMMMVSPSPRTARTKVAPKDVVIVFDHSGSMSGEKITQAKEALRFVLDNLNDDDRFNIVAYSDTVEAFFDGLKRASQKNINRAIDRLDRIQAKGATDIHEALRTAMEICNSKEVRRRGKRRPAYVIFLTDGKPTAGKTDERTILADTKEANESGARLFAFGVGYDVNVRLLDKLVLDNNGRSEYVKPRESVESKVCSLYAKIKNPVMTDVKVRVEGVKLRDVYPRKLGDLFDGDQIVLVGRYNRRRPARRRKTTLVVTGTYQGKDRGFEYPVTISRTGRRAGYDFIEQLWAVRRVGYLLDQIQLHGESDEVIDELVRLSKEYGIMTPYTSFLADESTTLSRPMAVRRIAEERADKLKSSVSGWQAQRDAKNRQVMNRAMRVPGASAPGGGAVQFGYSGRENFEAGEAETIANVRQVGNQAVYRRGRLWIASNATKLDPQKDADQIETIERFSEEYFKLVRANSIAENQILATQQPGEQLLIALRGQAYLIK